MVSYSVINILILQAGTEDEREPQESSSSESDDSEDSEDSDMPAAVQCAPS